MATAHGGAFRTTHWTEVLQAASPESAQGREAMGQLYRDYWYPLYAFIRWRGFSPEQAEDIAQDFFTRLIEKQALAGLHREGGKFRSFLLRSLENFLANEWHHRQAQKRGAGRAPISLDAESGEARYSLEPVDNVTPEVLFERQWVFTLLAHVMEKLREECAGNGKGELFQDLQPHLQGDRSGSPYAELAARRKMSEGAVKVAVHRLRQRYGELLRDEVTRTVSGPGEVEDELRYLISVLG